MTYESANQQSLRTSAESVRVAIDGRALSYIDTQDGVSNIWKLPLEGGPPKQVTQFTSEMIFSFDWSPDGKKLICARGHVSSNVVLIRNAAQ